MKAVSVLVRSRREVRPHLLEDVFLVVARTPEGLAWCPPGGKVHPGETPDAAARRELLEETGCEVLPEKSLHFVHSAPHLEEGGVEVTVFFCEYMDIRGVPYAAEGCPVSWMTWKQICADVFGAFYSRLPWSIR